MKPIVNYGLSDSLIDAVRKSVEEAKLHPNQQKLDVHEPKKDKLTSHDFRELRAGKHAGKHAGKKVKDGIDTHPKSMDEDEQIDELSVHKMLKYTDANKEKRKELNTKWDAGTATGHDQNKVLDHEAGADRAAARVKAKTGKYPHEIGKLSRIKYAITRKEDYEQMDEASAQDIVARLKKKHKDGNYRVGPGGEVTHPYLEKPSIARRIAALEEEEQIDEANSDNPEYEAQLAAIDMHHYIKADQHRRALQTLGTQGKLNTPEGKFHKAALEKHQAALNAMVASDHKSIRKKLKQSMRSNLKRKEVEQMDESLDSIAKKHGMKYTTTAYGAGMKHSTKGEISINRYGEWHHKGTNKTGDSENDFSSLDKHLSTVKEEEQMDEAPLRAVNALVGYPKLYKKVAAKGTPGSEDERNKAAAGLKRDRSGLGRRAYTGDQHYDVRREEVEQMDEVKLADLKVRNIAGTRYGGGAERDPYKDPEGADDAWEKERFSKKRKSGSQGPMKRRSPFNAKSAQRLGKLPTQY